MKDAVHRHRPMPCFAMVGFRDSRAAPPVSNNGPRFEETIRVARSTIGAAACDAALARLGAAGWCSSGSRTN